MRLFTRLFLSHLTTILLAEAVLVIGAELLAPSFYQGHIAQMLQVMNMLGPNPMQAGLRVDLVYGLRQTLTSALLVSLPIATSIAAIAAYLAARRVGKLAALLSEGSEAMAGGRYDLRLPPLGDDELGRLGVRFNLLAEKLQTVEKTRVEMIHTVAHELRTPLASIRGYAEALSDGVVPREIAIERITHEANAMSRIVDDLALVSRVEAKAVPIHIAAVDLGTLAADVVARFRLAFEEKGVGLTMTSPRAWPQVLADPERLTQVLSNLLANALRHTPSGGKVSMDLVPCSNRRVACLSIRDTGEGIEKNQQGRIFERFYRVSASREHRNAGSGVGLTIAKGLLEAMGGAIRLESSPGLGSTFTIELRLAE